MLRPHGFCLYTVHRNLFYIFSPYGIDNAVARYQADKLQRWALSLLSFKYDIENVPGEANVWGDLLSRWGAGPVLNKRHGAARVFQFEAVDRVSSHEEADIVWPSEDEIRQFQEIAKDKAPTERVRAVPVVYVGDRKLFVTATGTVWIPEDATEMQQRLCAAAHTGAGGNRGAKMTAMALEKVFY